MFLVDPLITRDNISLFIFLSIRLIETLVVCFILTTAVVFSNYFLTSFYLPNTLLILKFCLGLCFWTVLSAFPFVGGYFIIVLPFRAGELGMALGLGPEINSWVVFSIFFLFSLFLLLINSHGTTKIVLSNHKIKVKQDKPQKIYIKYILQSITLIILVVLVAELIIRPFLFLLII